MQALPGLGSNQWAPIQAAWKQRFHVCQRSKAKTYLCRLAGAPCRVRRQVRSLLTKGLVPQPPSKESRELQREQPRVQQTPDTSMASRQGQEANSGRDQQGGRLGTDKPQAEHELEFLKYEK